MTRTISSAALGFAFSLSLAACGEDRAAQAEELAERVCACEDAACAREAEEDFEDLLREVTEASLSEGEKSALRSAAGRFGECVREHAEGGGAGADEDAAGDT